MSHLYTSEFKESVRILEHFVKKWKREEREEWIKAKEKGTDRKEYVPRYRKEKL